MATLLQAKREGLPEFLIGSNVGVGKTAVSVAAVKRMANVRNVLVICPLPVAAGWRTHLKEMGDGGKRWCVINYESTKRLLEPPAKAATAKRTRTKNLHTVREGKPRVQWDVVITDEAHWLANPESQRSRAIEKIIGNPAGSRSAFVIRLSATAGSNPAQLAYLHRGLSYRSGESVRKEITMAQYAEWCENRGIGVSVSRYGNSLSWGKANSDLTKMNMLIFRGEPCWAIRRLPDWPEQQRIPLPMDLEDDEREAYEAEWSEFQDTMKRIERDRKARADKTMTRSARARAEAQSRAKGLAAQTRYRQKAGQVRAPSTASFAREMIAKGRQVCISCEYLGTASRVQEELEAAGVEVAMFTGENPTTREEERLRFQRGEAKVIIFTTTEGTNFHAGEKAAGATDTPRVTIVAEPRWSPKKALQVEGRAQRDGVSAPCYYPFAVDTVEEKVIKTVIAGMRDTGQINGDDTRPFDGLAKVLKVPFVVAA